MTRPGNQWRLVLSLACAFGATPLCAGALGLTNTQPLSFGKFVAGAGSITVSPSGTRVAAGDVIALESGPGQAAQFLVTGDPDMAYGVTLPSDGTVTISSGGTGMPVNAFTSSPASTVLSAGGSQTLSVGARLDVIQGKPPGEYSGSFDVIVEYN